MREGRGREREGGPGEICAFDWQVAINIQPTAPIRTPVHPMNGFGKRTTAACRRIFLPPPLPSSILNPSSSPLESFFALPQPSVSFIIQDGDISDYSSLAQDIHRSPSKLRLLCRLAGQLYIFLRYGAPLVYIDEELHQCYLWHTL